MLHNLKYYAKRDRREVSKCFKYFPQSSILQCKISQTGLPTFSQNGYEKAEDCKTQVHGLSPSHHTIGLTYDTIIIINNFNQPKFQFIKPSYLHISAFALQLEKFHFPFLSLFFL
jgi:hypothetical protein